MYMYQVTLHFIFCKYTILYQLRGQPIGMILRINLYNRKIIQYTFVVTLLKKRKYVNQYLKKCTACNTKGHRLSRTKNKRKERRMHV